MSSASLGASHRKPTRRPGRKPSTLRPDPNTSGTAGVWVVKYLPQDLGDNVQNRAQQSISRLPRAGKTLSQYHTMRLDINIFVLVCVLDKFVDKATYFHFGYKHVGF